MVGKITFKLDNGLLKWIQEVSALPEEAKNQVFQVMEALISDFKTKQA
jgi:hypothetical protein